VKKILRDALWGAAPRIVHSIGARRKAGR